MSGISSAPGSSLQAQLREGRAVLRRNARRKAEAALNAIADENRRHRAAMVKLEAAHLEAVREYQELEDRLRGRNQTPEVVLTPEVKP